MARYGTFRYGDGTKYGEITVNKNLLYVLEVDWDDDGVYEANEAIRAYKLRVDRGRDYYISARGIGFDSEKIGQAVVTLDNYDGRYDPYNASSDLYGNLEPGRKCKLWVRDGIGGTDYAIIAGVITDIQPVGYRDSVDLIIEDGWRWLQDRDVNVTLQEVITADEAIEAILTAANWPWGSSLETGPDRINYWWTTGKKAKGEIEDLANSGLGNVFVAADGSLKYYSRQRVDDPVLILEESEVLKDVVMPQPWEFKRNIIKIKVNPRVLQTSQVIWKNYDIPKIPAGDSITIWAVYKYEGVEVPAKDVVTPVANTDYTANENDAGTGIDYTANINVSISKFSNTAKITYTNSGAYDAYLTLAQLRGKPIHAPDTSAIIEEGTEASKCPRLLEINLLWQQNYNTGSSLAEVLLDFLEDQQYFPTILIQGRPQTQLKLDLYDKVTLKLDTWGIDQNFRIGKISHRWTSETGQDILTEIKLFPYYIPPVETYWYIGTAGKSELGVTTYLGY